MFLSHVSIDQPTRSRHELTFITEVNSAFALHMIASRIFDNWGRTLRTEIVSCCYQLSFCYHFTLLLPLLSFILLTCELRMTRITPINTVFILTLIAFYSVFTLNLHIDKCIATHLDLFIRTYLEYVWLLINFLDYNLLGNKLVCILLLIVKSHTRTNKENFYKLRISLSLNLKLILQIIFFYLVQ